MDFPSQYLSLDDPRVDVLSGFRGAVVICALGPYAEGDLRDKGMKVSPGMGKDALEYAGGFASWRLRRVYSDGKSRVYLESSARVEDCQSFD